MRTIWKWQVWPHSCIIEAPKGTEFLTAQAQCDVLKVWGICDPEQPLARHQFLLLETGKLHTEDDFGKYLGTVQFSNGYVLHVFVLRKI